MPGGVPGLVVLVLVDTVTSWGPKVNTDILAWNAAAQTVSALQYIEQLRGDGVAKVSQRVLQFDTIDGA